MKRFLSSIIALTLSIGAWAETTQSVITFTSNRKLYPGDIISLLKSTPILGGMSEWDKFIEQYPEFNDTNPYQLKELGVVFNPKCFQDAIDALDYTYNYDEATLTGTITTNGELVTLFGYDLNNNGQSAFCYCSSLTGITLPEGLATIGEGTFYECSSLASVTLPQSLTTIGKNAFCGCKALLSITIPANVTYIGSYAFENCTGLTDVYVPWTTKLPTLDSNVFSGVSVSTTTLHVPVGSKALYQATKQWKDFVNIVEYDPIADVKVAAIETVNASIAETDNDNVKAIATAAITSINAATAEEEVNALKTLALAAIASAKAAYNSGKTEAFGELGTEKPGTVVKVTKGDTEVILYAPNKVEYIIRK